MVARPGTVRSTARRVVLACAFAGAWLGHSADGVAAPKHAAARKTAPRASGTTSRQAAAPPLTAEALGLGNISLRSIKEEEARGGAPPVTPAPTPTPDAPAPGIEARERLEPATVTPARALEHAAPDRVVEPPAAAPRRSFTVTVNPVPAVAGRYGANLEFVPARHHAFIASGWVQTFPPWMLERLMPEGADVRRAVDTMLGGELGYRWYSGLAGANGFFIGASGVAMPLALPRIATDLRAEAVSFHAYGGALDVGVQAITASGFTIGGGLGAMALAYAPPSPALPPSGAGPFRSSAPHVLPRLLLAAGWSF